MSSVEGAEYDYRGRFEQFKVLETQKAALITELLDRLDLVQAERDTVKKDLEVQQDTRRRLQDDISRFLDLEKTMKQGRFAVVLIDADADAYLFHERFLNREEKGGQEAAEELMTKVRQYLQPHVEDAAAINVVVKAYASFYGLAQACLKNGKVKIGMSLNQFIIGFNRRYPLFDFVDVGPGKEEADTKLKDVLEVYFTNPQCQHIILGCYHDQGYVPFLRKFHQTRSISEKITLLKTAPQARKMESLGFKNTDEFNSIFSSESPSFTPASPVSVSSGTTVDSARLSPIIYGPNGKRMDKNLLVSPKLLAQAKKLGLCSRHFLREDCPGCKYSHAFTRPLSPEMYDAVWLLARLGGLCYTVKRKKDCEDNKCIYRHCA